MNTYSSKKPRFNKGKKTSKTNSRTNNENKVKGVNNTHNRPAQEAKVDFPMQLSRYLALQGYCTRREASEIISKGIVGINGKIGKIGDKVQKTDNVTVRSGGQNGLSSSAKNYKYYAYNKAVGIVTHSPTKGEKDIVGSIHMKGIFPIGRLDKASHGLIILTNDGRITDRLLNPIHEHEKEYIVRTAQKLRPSFKEHMEAGVDIGGHLTKRCKVKMLGEKTFSVILSEGKNHQIRRMVSALHNDVSDLQRIRIMNIRMGKISPGQFRPIEGTELELFLKNLGLRSS